MITCELFKCCNLCYPISWHQIGADIDGEAAGDQSGRSVSLSSDGTVLAIGAWHNDAVGFNSGHVRVYEWKADTSPPSWVQRGIDIDGEAFGDYSGASVSLSNNGTVLAIGARFNNDYYSGHVRVYEWNGDSWDQMGADIDGEYYCDESGYSVSLSSDGTVLAIGAVFNDANGDNSGHVRVYEYNGSSWDQRGDDIDGEAAGDYSGGSVSLSSDGTVLAIGATGNGASYSGHVRVYEWEGDSSWQQRGDDIDGEAAGDGSGYSVSLSSDGTIVAIGATGNDGNSTDDYYQSGHVRVYQWIAGTSDWDQMGADIDGEAAGDKSGWSVSLSSNGTVLAIGAAGNDANGGASGNVRVYEWKADTSSPSWQQRGSDIYGEAASDLSGWSVSMSSDGTILAIGAPHNDNAAGYDFGHVRVYEYVI